MDPTSLALAREALLLVVILSAPPLLAALAAGLVVGVVQAATQIQEPTVSVGPRLAATLAALGAAAPWIAARTARFAAACLDAAARGGP